MGKTQRTATQAAQNTHAKKKVTLPKLDSNAMNLLKSILFGPIVAILAIGTIYIAWWGLSKLFYLIHNWMIASVVPWCEGAWPYMLGIWAFVLITSIAVPMLVGKVKKFSKKNLKDNGKDIEIIDEGVLTR